jgi:hypothetical protein
MQDLSDVFGDRISNSVIWQHVPQSLILVIFSSRVVLRTKVITVTVQKEDELKKIFIGKLQIFLQNSFKE